MTNSMTNTKEVLQNPLVWYQDSFAAFERRLNGNSGSALHATRKAALRRFLDIGFPTTRNEEWRFTNITPIARTPFRTVFEPSERKVTNEAISRWMVDDVKAHHLVFVNGHFVPALSVIHELPKGVYVGSLAQAIKNCVPGVDTHLAKHASIQDSPFTALSTAFIQDGACVIVPDGVTVSEPVIISLYAAPDGEPIAVQPRNLIVIGRGAKLSIAETYSGDVGSTYLTNAVTEVVVGENAIVEHDKLQFESRKGFHVGSTYIRMEANSSFTSNSIALGGAIARNNVTALLAAGGSECTLNGLSLSTGQQLIDNHTTIDHDSANCTSHELYKAILDGASRGVFNGKIFVRRDAQKTDAKQTNKSLLLSEQATIDTKPQLEIFADDVKCTHGATVGQLDEEQVFYLRSRGIGEAEARDLLTFAFAGDIINKVHLDHFRTKLEQLIRARLHEGRVTVED